MIAELMGDVIDIHGGGRDLVFPHHENELAQSQVRAGWGAGGSADQDQPALPAASCAGVPTAGCQLLSRLMHTRMHAVVGCTVGSGVSAQSAPFYYLLLLSCLVVKLSRI
jgi:hypothetical protein